MACHAFGLANSGVAAATTAADNAGYVATGFNAQSDIITAAVGAPTAMLVAADFGTVGLAQPPHQHLVQDRPRSFGIPKRHTAPLSGVVPTHANAQHRHGFGQFLLPSSGPLFYILML